MPAQYGAQYILLLTLFLPNMSSLSPFFLLDLSVLLLLPPTLLKFAITFPFNVLEPLTVQLVDSSEFGLFEVDHSQLNVVDLLHLLITLFIFKLKVDAAKHQQI